MTTIGHASMTTGISAAMGAVMMQTTSTASSSAVSLVIPAVSAIIGAVVSFVVLKTTVQRMEEDMRNTRKDIGEMYALLRESLTKIAHLEGRLDQRS